MKKKGFTLIELLAVIVILAIIALISTPIIIGVIDKARKGAFEDSAYGVIDAGRLYFIDKLADDNKFAGETFDFTKANNLKLAGEAPAGGTLVIDNSGRQALAIYDKDKRWCATKTFEEEKVTIKEYKDGECKAEGSASAGSGVTGSITDKNKPGNTEGLFTDDYGNIRYRGASPKNYVTFNNEAWRIIGIVDGKVKLIKDEGIPNPTDSANPNDFQWNSTNINEWIGSSLQTYLNNNYYASLTEVAKSQIEDHTYKLGGILDANLYSKDSYKLERETTVFAGRSTVWTGKIGLAYLSDYGYAAGIGCTQTLYFYNDMACRNDDWLYKPYWWWTMTPWSGSSRNVSLVSSDGYALGLYAGDNWMEARPALHLKSNIQLTGGDGTSTNPYTLS